MMGVGFAGGDGVMELLLPRAPLRISVDLRVETSVLDGACSQGLPCSGDHEHLRTVPS